MGKDKIYKQLKSHIVYHITQNTILFFVLMSEYRSITKTDTNMSNVITLTI